MTENIFKNERPVHIIVKYVKNGTLSNLNKYFMPS